MNDDESVDRELRGRSHVARAILLQYFAIKVHIYHMLDPVRSPELMRLSAAMSQMCLRLIRLGAFSSSNSTPSPSHISDMPISFVFAIIGCLMEDEVDRIWVRDYLFQLGREGMWCGYERALCLQAWWKSSQMFAPYNTGIKRLIKSIPLRDELPLPSSKWTPDVGMGVEIIYENIQTGEIGTDRYFLDGRVHGVV